MPSGRATTDTQTWPAASPVNHCDHSAPQHWNLRNRDCAASLPQRHTKSHCLLIRGPYASLQRTRDHSCFPFLACEGLERTNVLFRPRLKLHLFRHSHPPNHIGIQTVLPLLNYTRNFFSKTRPLEKGPMFSG